MGKGSRIRRERSEAAPTVTHEPAVVQNWPDGHVAVALTGDDQGECIEVTVHGVKHYLHSSTARELSNMLISNLEKWNTTASAAGFPTV